MSDTDSLAEMPARSPSPKSPKPAPGAKQEPPNSGITISLLEIGSLPTFCYDSFPPPKNSIYPVAKRGKVQKFSNLLKDVKDVLKNIAGFEENSVGEPFDDVCIPEDLSELKVRSVDKRNKIRFKDDLFINSDSENELNTMKQEMLLKTQSAKNMAPKFARDLCNSEEKRCFDGVQLNVKRRRNGSFHIRGEYRKLRNNMEQLLQEADHWSKQHNELSEIMRSYQECQKEMKETNDDDQVSLQTPTNNNQLSTKQMLQEQVKKLSHDTHSLHLIAALLENECQILQQRVDILKEFHLHEAGPGHEKPLQVSCEQDKKCPKLVEVDKMDASKHTMRTAEGVITRKPKILRSPDDCLTKKARNNRFNARVAKKSLVGKRRTISSFR